MDHLAWGTNADSSAPSAVIPGWAVEAGGVILRIEARVVVRILEGDQDTMPPQLISHFCRRRISASDVDAAEHAHFTISPPFYYINHEPAWKEQTQRMFSHVAANCVRPADLELLAEAFRRYTYAVFDLFLITELVFMEFFSIVEIPITPSASASGLRYFIPPETYEYFFGGDDDIDDIQIQFGRGSGPTFAAAVEGLQMITVGEGSSCPICLDDFEVMSQVLAMPCGHPFHEGCLMEWLKRSHSCPLCRFSLPAAEFAS
ncbi:uncharacterized protein LOC141843427 [Curcuma longa]|uniref:uncharacterized protein LOC141843427 n=1 Tax=Curcuma longa TaxID=136217 RepID=UPI003D9DC960